MTSLIMRPIFIVAPPRSGATLLLNLLQGLPGLSPLHETPEVIESVCGSLADRGWLSHRLTAADATAEVAAAVSTAHYSRLHHSDQRLLEQTEHNALRVSFLASIYPDAQFVCVLRQPPAAMTAALAAWSAGDAITEPSLPGWSGLPWSMALIPNWQELNGKPPAEIVIRQWSTIASILLDDLEALASERWRVVAYERLIGDPRQELGRLAAFLGIGVPAIRWLPAPDDGPVPAELEAYLPLAESAMRRVNDLLAGSPRRRQRPPVQPPAINPEEAFGSVATPVFAEILHDFGISLVVTTYQSGRVILVRAPESEQLNTHLRILPSPMGVAVSENKLAIGTHQEIVEFRNQPEVAASLNPPNLNDVVLMPAHIHVTGDIRIHEIGWVGEELWLVNTLFSMLCTLDHEYSFVPRWRPPFVTQLSPEDRCHLNGMAYDADGVRYVTAIGETDTPGGWRANKASGGVLIDVPSGATVVRGLSMPHSPRLYAERLWLLESGRGTLATADPASGRVETIAELPGFTRGLAFVGPFAFVGLSQVRESNIFGGIPLVERVKARECGVWIVDIRNGAIVAFLRFEGIVQEIFDVQVLSNTRFPELLELHDPHVATSFRVPAAALSETSRR